MARSVRRKAEANDALGRIREDEAALEQLPRDGLAGARRDTGNAGYVTARDFATQENRCLVTFRVGDFVRLHNRWIDAGRKHAGIIVSKQLVLQRNTKQVGNIDEINPRFLSLAALIYR